MYLHSNQEEGIKVGRLRRVKDQYSLGRVGWPGMNHAHHGYPYTTLDMVFCLSEKGMWGDTGQGEDAHPMIRRSE